MRIALALAVWFGFTSCAQLQRKDPRTTRVEVERVSADRPLRDSLRVVTYNVHMASARDLTRVFAQSRALAAADVILLQEIQDEPGRERSEAAKLANALGYHSAYAPGYRVGADGSHGVAILSRYPLSDIEVSELPRYHVVFNSARRVALSATVMSGRGPIRIVNVHLDNRLNPEDRARQLDPVLRAAAQERAPVLIAGDVNTSPFCWGGHVVPVPCGLQDGRLESHVRRRGFETPVTKSGSTHKWLGMRLDGLYSRGLRVLDYRVERSVRLSDHLPLWADIRVRGS